MRHLLLLTGIIAVLAGANARNASTAEKLVAGYSSMSPAEWTLVTAAKVNLFEKYGLDVSTVYLGGSTRIVQVMIAGDIHIGQIGGSAALFGKAAGVDTAVIATTINRMAAQVISRPEIKTVADLKGKALGVTRRGANTDYWARFGLTHHGLAPDKDVKILYTGDLRDIWHCNRNKFPPRQWGWKIHSARSCSARVTTRSSTSSNSVEFPLQRHRDDQEILASQTARGR